MLRIAKTTRRAANEQDTPFLLRLRHETMGPHIAVAGLTLTDEENLNRVQFRMDCAEVVLLDGEPVGMIKVDRDADPWKILQLQIAPQMQGHGIGGELVSELIAEAQSAGVGLALSVLKANAAKQLYQRLGFVVTGESDLEFDMQWRVA
jgi:ribosomal protein S18 acetylase RimI-like enzyme